MLTSRVARFAGDYQPSAITPVSRRDALCYATAVSALAGLDAASVGFGTPTAAAAAPQLIDFAARQIPAQHIRAAGYSGVVNYVFTRGFAGGVADARTAWQLHTAAGGGHSAPIFFTIDEDINRNAWNTVALQWFRGINAVLGVQRTGVYGGIDVCQWAAADGVIGNSSTPGHRWAWQTRAWSGNQIHPAAVLYQRVVSTASNPGPLVGGLEVDVNDVLAPDCGQWNLHP